MLKLVAMIIAAFAGVAAQSQVGPSIDHHHYANQTPYGNAAAAPIKTPPKGYQLAFLETVGRHGARTLTNSGAERRSLSVWKRAAGQYATTSLGNRFAKDLRVFQQAEQRVGYGNLSTIGAAEWRASAAVRPTAIARSWPKRLPPAMRSSSRPRGPEDRRQRRGDGVGSCGRHPGSQGRALRV